MADEKVGLVVKVKVHGEQQLRKLKREINGLNDHVTLLKNRVNANLDSMDAKWKKHFDGVDKMVKAMGGALTKFVGMSAKFAAVQLGALGAAMIAVHGAFVLGNAAMKAFRYLAKGVAAGLAAVAVAAGTAAAAIRENQAAMFAYKKLGKNEFGSGMNQVRQEMRAMARDTDLAGLSAKDLNSIYSEISKKGTYTQSSQALVKSLMDFGAAGQDVAKGAQSVGALVGMLQDPKATFSQITNSAKDLGPAMENALKEAKTKGIDTVAELKAAILDGTLSVIGGVNGQFAAVNDTLIGRFKKAMNIIKADFADFGQIFLGPSKDALSEIQHTIRRTLVQVTGSITAFGKGSMMDGLTSGFAKLADGFGNMINNYLPKAEGMLKGVGDWWGRFKSGWNDVLDRTRPFIDAARVLENMLKNILQPIFSQFGNAMDNTRQLILDNKGAFEEFGTRVGAFIEVFGRYASTVRDVFVQALPFINQIVDGATKLFDMFTNILGVARNFAGLGGPAGAFGLAGGLMAAGRGMKKTIGGVVPDYAKMQKTQFMEVKADSVSVTGGGMASKTGGGIVNAGQSGLANAGKPVLFDPYGRPLITGPGMRSRVGGGVPAGATPTGTGVTPAGGRQIAPGYVRGPHNKGIYETASGRKLTMKDPNWWKAMTSPNTPGYLQSAQGVDPSRLKKFSGMYGPRSWRTTEMYGKMFGDADKGYKGWNNSGTATMGATLGLGLLSNVAPESSKGALALGSSVAMFNPMAGLAVGGLGSAVTGTNTGFSAVSGAMGGAAAGSFLGLPGIAAGAIVGALVGGIMSAINKKKENLRLAREAGRNMAQSMQSEMMGGISSAMATSTQMVAGMARTTAEANLQTIIDRNKSMAAQYGDYSNSTDDQIREAVATGNTMGTGIFGNMSYEDIQGMGKNPQEFIASGVREFEVMRNAAQTTMNIYESRMGQYTEMFGMDSNEVFDMARRAGVNLMDVTTDFTMSVNQLTSSLINNTAELNNYMAETFANMYDIVDTAKKAAEGPKIYDEAARTVFDKQLAGTLGSPDIADFLGTALQQFPAMYGGGPGGQMRGLIEFVNQFSENGAAFQYGPNGEQLPLTGLSNVFYDNGANEAIMNPLINTGRTSLARSSSELLTSTVARSGLQFNDPNAAKNFGANITALSGMGPMGAAIATGYTTQAAAFGDRYDLATSDTERSAVQSEVETWLSSLPDMFGDLSYQVLDILPGSVATQADKIYQAIIDVFKPGFTLTAGTVTVTEAATANVTSSGTTNIYQIGDGGDTKFNKSNALDSRLGDTAGNLSKTLDAHSRLDNGAGKRIITSSYRNFGLGSSNSDHVNGRAYDLVGDNLISYRDAVKRDGGFAQFHGDTQNRHLHVVPRIGDSASPAYAIASGVASAASNQSSGAPVYNITVNGAGSNPEEIANLVMHKIKVTEKINSERTY